MPQGEIDAARARIKTVLDLRQAAVDQLRDARVDSLAKQMATLDAFLKAIEQCKTAGVPHPTYKVQPVAENEAFEEAVKGAAFLKNAEAWVVEVQNASASATKAFEAAAAAPSGAKLDCVKLGRFLKEAADLSPPVNAELTAMAEKKVAEVLPSAPSASARCTRPTRRTRWPSRTPTR